MSDDASIPRVEFPNGMHMPVIGFGTHPLRGATCTSTVGAALEVGFRLFDAAANYHNESEIGRAIQEFMWRNGTAREDFVVQTKVPARQTGREQTRLAVSDSTDLLGLGTIDVVLLHAPQSPPDGIRESWEALLELQAEGQIGVVGLSNSGPEVIADLVAHTGVAPAIHQIELNAYKGQADLRALHGEHGILTQAWNPLGGASAYAEAPWADIAKKHGVTADQVVLRWHFQSGTVTLPTPTKPMHQREVVSALRFELTDDEMARMSAHADQPQPDPWQDF